MFFEAQERFKKGQIYGNGPQSSYIQSLMQQYGDGGRKVNKFRESSQADFERALEFRRREKEHYSALENDYTSMMQRMQTMQTQIESERARNLRYATYINTISNATDKRDGDVAPRTDDGDGVDGDRRGVLPAVHADPEARQGEITSNASSETDASVPRSGTRRQRRPVGTKPSVDETGDRNGEGGSSERPGDGPAPDASGQADEHVVEERGGDD